MEKSPAATRATIPFLKHKAEVEGFFNRTPPSVYTYLQLQEAILLWVPEILTRSFPEILATLT